MVVLIDAIECGASVNKPLDSLDLAAMVLLVGWVLSCNCPVSLMTLPEIIDMTSQHLHYNYNIFIAFSCNSNLATSSVSLSVSL